MAVTDSTKIDLLLKKLYGVAKTDTAGNKSPSNEAINSPLLTRGDVLWTQASTIPSTAAAVSGVVQSYLTTNKVQCTADATSVTISSVYPTWKTGVTDWIPPEFDSVNLINSYRVKVYYGAAGLSDPASSGGTQLFADGSSGTGEWYFDYQAGILHFIGGTIPLGMNSSHVIYIYGYRYIGSKSVNTLVAPPNSDISLTTTGTGKVNIVGNFAINGVTYGAGDSTLWYVSDSTGVDTNSGHTETAPLRTVKYALSQALSGDTVFILPGTYEEIFPLTVPQGVSVIGAGLRSTTIVPTLATKNKDCFLLNGETTVQELTIKDMFYDAINNTGYAFRFNSVTVVSQRSPYVQRVTVLNKGSVTTSTDPYGFLSGDAGRGVYIDGSVVSRASLEAAILFNECTFIVPNSRALIMTNGARTEWLNCFTYFADLAIEGVIGVSGRGGDGKTYIELNGVTGTFNAGNTLSYYDIDGITVLASATIESVSGSTLIIDGSASGFSIATNRQTKTVTASGDAIISTAQKKFGAASLLLDGTGDYIRVAGDQDFSFGTGDFTFETFFYRNVTAGTQVIFDFRSGSTINNPYLYASGTSLIYGANNAPQINVTGVLPSTGTWYHVAAVRASGTVKIYVNGVQVGGSYVDLNDYTYPVNVYIGANYVGTGGVNGYLDEIRITKGFARYTATPFVVPTAAFSNDQYTSLLLHLNTNLDDDGGAVQDIRSSSGGTATKIVRYDRKEFAAEMRSIAGANVYGNQGIKADGADVVLQLMAHNFAYIGTGFDLTNNAAGVVQEDEVIEVNGGKVFYSSVDQKGDFRVGNYFRVNSETGAVTFNVPNFNVTSLTGITFTDGTNTTIVNPTTVATGNLILAGNTISSATGPITVDPSGSNIINLNADTNVAGTLDVGLQATLASVNVEDLTSDRIVIAGTNGELQDNVNLTFNGTKLTVTGDAEITGDLTIGGNLTLGNQDTDSINITADFTSNLIPNAANTYNLGAVGKEWANAYVQTITSTTISNGTITLTGNTVDIITANTNLVLEPSGTGRLVVNTTTALQIPVGTEAQRPATGSVGDLRLNTTTARVENYNGEQWNTMANEDDAIAFSIALG